MPSLLALPNDRARCGSFGTPDLSAAGFVSRLRTENAALVLDVQGVWESYVDDYADHGSANDRPLTRNQLFRQLRAAGMRRFRSGARDGSGKRPYLYRLASPGRRGRRPGRSVDGVHVASTHDAYVSGVSQR